MIDTILVIGGYYHSYGGIMLVGGFEVYIGLDSDYSNNEKCDGGPFLLCNGCNYHNSKDWHGGFEAKC